MHLALCVSVVDDSSLGGLKNTLRKSKSYVDDVYVLLGEANSPKIIKWCRENRYNYLIHEDSEIADKKLAERLTYEGVEFIVWLDAGDVITDVEELLINNVRHPVRYKVAAENEITYYANFGGPALEKWSPKRLKTGIGGSELAVIMLSNMWQKMGYKVTVYGDPGLERGYHNGVLYLPWYEFNRNDYYNIFIHWRFPRNSEMSRHIMSRRYYLDLHDVWNEEDVLPHIDSIDGIFVKSKYHRNIAPNIPDEKFHIIGNGVLL